MDRKIILGSQSDALSKWQAKNTQTLLQNQGYESEVKIFEEKNLEEALLSNQIDIALFWLNQVKTELPESIMIAGVSRREEPSDIILMQEDFKDNTEKFCIYKSAKVGVASNRAKNQILSFRPDLKIIEVEENFTEMLRQLHEKKVDAIIIPAMLIEILEIDTDDFHVETLSAEEFIPSPSQGITAYLSKDDNNDLLEVIDSISDLDVLIKTNIERDILRMLDLNHTNPIGIFCDTDTNEDDRLKFKVWISVATNWKEQCQQFHFNTFDTDGFSDKVAEHILHLKPKNIFITRDLSSKDYLKKVLDNLKFDVTAKSLIENKQIKINHLPQTDWAFFSNKLSVKFFMSQKPKLPANIKFGCMGTNTSAELRAFGKRADFIGTSSDIKLVGKQFSSKVGNGRVMFVIARDSHQSLQWQMVKRENVFNLEAYATLKNSIEVDAENVMLIFTSPQNFESYLEKNKIQPHQKIISVGEATSAFLIKNKIKEFIRLENTDDLTVLRAVLSN